MHGGLTILAGLEFLGFHPQVSKFLIISYYLTCPSECIIYHFFFNVVLSCLMVFSFTFYYIYIYIYIYITYKLIGLDMNKLVIIIIILLLTYYN